MTALPWVRDDGGRAAAGFRGDAGDCVTRALSIASGVPYRDVYDALAKLAGKTVRDGTPRKAYDRWLLDRGAVWTPTMQIGTGCRVHLAAGELPAGRLVVRLSRHLCAVVDGTVRDTHDPGRDGTRCVYGVWTMP